MKRRQFITQSVLMGAGLSLLPNGTLLSLPPALPTKVNLGTVMEHIRHGQFSTQPVVHPKLPHWIQLFQPHTFYADGFQKSENDINHWGIQLFNEVVHINEQQERFHVLSNNSTQAFTLENDNPTPLLNVHPLNVALCKFTQSSDCLVAPKNSELVIVILNGSGTIGETTVDSNTALVFEERAKMKVIPENELLALILRC